MRGTADLEVAHRKSILRDHKDVRAVSHHVHWEQQCEDATAYREYQTALATALKECDLEEAGRKCGILDAKHDKSRQVLATVHGQLQTAVCASRMDAVRALCVAGAEIDDALVAAVSRNLVEPTAYLLQHAPKASGLLLVAALHDANEAFDEVARHYQRTRRLAFESQFKTHDGCTVLHVAVWKRNVDLLKICARYDDFVHIGPCLVDKQTALAKAASYGQLDALQVLIDGLHADIHAWDGQGHQPIHIAAMLGYSRCVDLLLARGADPESRDKTASKRTPLEHCELGLHSGRDPNRDFAATKTLLLRAAAETPKATTPATPRTPNVVTPRHHKKHHRSKHHRRHHVDDEAPAADWWWDRLFFNAEPPEATPENEPVMFQVTKKHPCACCWNSASSLTSDGGH